jgi:hypothetical protein
MSLDKRSDAICRRRDWARQRRHGSDVGRTGRALLHDAPKDVTLNWIVDHLGERSFGIIMLIIALVGLVPGASPFSGILLAVPAIQMMMARPAPVLPRIIANRRVSTPRLVRLLERVIPVLKRMECVVRPAGVRRSKQRSECWVLSFCF